MNWYIWRLLTVVLLLGGLPAFCHGAEPAAKPITLEQLRDLRKQAAHRQRRVIFNNDGCDCLYYPRNKKADAAGFLDQRTTPLAGTQVDAIAYCTISSGFSNFTHRTKVGTLLTRSASEFEISPEMRNITQDLIDQGTDCLAAVLGFAHAHKMECFWSMRMNDTHDVAHTPEHPYFLFPKLKYDHPEWLVGNPLKRTPYGRWSSVDYTRPEIRDLALQYLEEVCRNYDLDGVELDFFRHLCYFKSVANGGKASPQELDMMTELVARVRTMTEEIGLRRGRPILVAVRVPDSVEFCRDMGLDIEQWLQRGLADLLVTTCYFQLNPWEYSVRLGHKYGVPVYPCLSDARVEGESRFSRSSVECYRGRAMNAWAAGADGIHLFNLFDVFGSRSPVFKEVGDPKGLARLNKLYFATLRDGDPNRWLSGGSKYGTVPILTPAHPHTIKRDRPLAIDVMMGDDLGAGHGAKVSCHLLMPRLSKTAEVAVRVNGHALTGGKMVDGWLDLPVPAERVRRYANRVEVTLDARALPGAPEWSIAYEGGKKPGRPWRRDPGSVRTDERLEAGGLRIADRGSAPGDYLYYRYTWGADPAGLARVEARVKVVSGLSQVIISNGVGQERLAMWPDRIELWSNRKLSYRMDTTADFHVYRLQTQGKDVKVYVDDQLRIDAPGAYRASAGNHNELAFGAADSTAQGEACWRYVRAGLDSQVCQDVVMRVGR